MNLGRVPFIIFSLILAGISSGAYAQMIPTEATILRVSRSKQSVILDRGHLDGWRPGDYAVFLLRPDSQKEAHYYVGTARMTQVEGNASTWLFSEVGDANALYEGSKVVVKNQRLTFNGRVNKPMTNIQKISTPSGENESFPPKSNQNSYAEKNIQAPLPLPNDLDSGVAREQSAQWEKTSERLDQSGEKKSVLDVGPFSDDRTREEIQELVEEDEFYRQNEQDLQELNDPEFTLTEKYRNSNRELGLNDFSPLTTTPNTYQKAKDFLTNEQLNYQREAKDLITEDGPDWSEHFTDAELAEFVNRTGMVEEIDRQRDARESVEFLNDVSLFLGTNVSDSGQDEDIKNQNSSTLGIGIYHEINLGKRWDALKSFSFVYGGFSQDTNISLEAGNNGAGRELAVKGMAIWYPFQNPLLLARPLFYFGLGMKRGKGTVKRETSGDSVSYSTSSFADFAVGLKYRIARRWGTKVSVDYSSTTWRKSDLGENVVFPGESINNELKIAAAVSFYF